MTASIEREQDSRKGKLLSFLLLAVSSAMIFALAYFSPASSADSDPYLALLVSQAILEQRTVKLDAYQERAQPPFASYAEGGPLITRRGHYYYYYPVGTSVFAVPAVWAANRLGQDMAVQQDNHALQNLLSALSSAAIFLLLYALCRVFLTRRESWLAALVLVAGSSLISTMGAALWSVNLAVLSISLALWLLARRASGQSETIHPYLFGFCLFAAYFCRASTASFILAALVYLWWTQRSRGEALRASLTAFLLLLAFLAFSWLEYGEAIPQYYSVDRFQVQRAPLLLALYGHLLSPSRGLLIYSPFLAPLAVGAIWLFRELKRRPLFWLCSGWLALHFVSAWRSARWWGGYSFGSRLFAELIPAFALLTALLWSLIKEKAGARAQRLFVNAYLVLGLAGMLINSYQGLTNLNTEQWNGPLAPDIDRHPEYLLDWEYPQFLASRESLCQRNREYSHAGLATSPRLGTYALGATITYDAALDDIGHDDRESYKQAFLPETILRSISSGLGLGERPEAATPEPVVPDRDANPALLIGWSVPEAAGYRWSECPEPEIAFRLDTVDPAAIYVLEVNAGSFGPQVVIVWLNEYRLGVMDFPGPGQPAVLRTLALEGKWLRPRNINIIRFKIFEAQTPSASDPRQVGLALVSWRIRP